MWFFNTKLNRWYHPSGETSDNGPNDPPAEPSGMGLGDIVAAGIKVATLGMISNCASCEERRRKLNELGKRITG